jgi:hypothetical protein
VMMLQTGNPDVRFKPRLVEGVTLTNPPEPERLILDGQQLRPPAQGGWPRLPLGRDHQSAVVFRRQDRHPPHLPSRVVPQERHRIEAVRLHRE